LPLRFRCSRGAATLRAGSRGALPLGFLAAPLVLAGV
jgi:hypothetical protein